MPELPEVEIFRRKLAGWLEGRTVTNVASNGRHRGVEVDLITALLGRPIQAVDRVGKYLLLRFGDAALVIHLGMSGRLLCHIPAGYVSGPHDHIRISTDDGKLIVFQDHRRFGRVFWSPMDLSALPPLGPDPTQVDVSPRRLSQILSTRKGRLKPILMDQTVISGLGNIYTCEILWAARLSPSRLIETLKTSDYEALSVCIVTVLKQAIDAGGSTLDDYRGTSGEMGNFDRHFAVFGQTSQTCPRCQSSIDTQRLSGRITYWCPGCQL